MLHQGSSGHPGGGLRLIVTHFHTSSRSMLNLLSSIGSKLNLLALLPSFGPLSPFLLLIYPCFVSLAYYPAALYPIFCFHLLIYVHLDPPFQLSGLSVSLPLTVALCVHLVSTLMDKQQ